MKKKIKLLNFNLILVILWMIAVFIFSSQNSEKSLSLSSKVIKIVNKIEEDLGKLNKNLESKENTINKNKLSNNDNLSSSNTENEGNILNDKEENLSSENISNGQQFVTRKSAHFLLYFFGGILILNYIKSVFKVKKIQIFLSLLIANIYAVSDEIHQLFTPGRSSKLLDVGIDTLGALCGIILFITICKIRERHISNRTNK